LDLHETIQRVRQALGGSRLWSEAEVRQAFVLPILRALGWNDADTAKVTPEFNLDGQRVDYALSAMSNQVSIFIEVKARIPLSGFERQLFTYAAIKGVPLAVLTNGQEWRFFLPGGIGSYDERLLHRLDLIERQTSESAEWLSRYLLFDRVRSGDALTTAQGDYEGLRRDRIMRDALPHAWAEVLGEPDAQLVEILADRTALLCRHKPSPDFVAEFLRKIPLGNLPATFLATLNPSPATKPGPVRQELTSKSPTQPDGKVAEPVRYTLFGETRTARSGMQVLLHVIRELAARDPGFLERFAPHIVGDSSNHVARRPEDVYPGRLPRRGEVIDLVPGWYIGTTLSTPAKTKLLQAACTAAGLTFDVDLIVQLPKRTRVNIA
jgi:predicted type IV restriction endonuclease